MGVTGIGFTLAMQDAHALATSVRKHGVTEQALRRQVSGIVRAGRIE